MEIKVTTAGDVTGINKIEAAHTSLMSKVKEDFKAIQGKSPMQIAADTMTHERKLGDLDRRSRDIERKIMATRIRISEGTLDVSGKQRVGVLQNESLKIQLARSQAMETQRFAVEEKQRRGRMIAPFMGAGRKVLGYGSMIAGGLGAYSLLSKVFGEMEGVRERNIAYGTALSVTRGRGETLGDIPTDQPFSEVKKILKDLDYSPTDQPFFEVRKALKSLGEISVITAKDMAPMLEVAKEIGDVSGGIKGTPGARLAQIANLGKFLGVESPAIAGFLTQGIRGGGFTGDIQATDMGKMMLLNQSMMHRATESLQAMQQVMTGTTHGVQGLGAFNMLNLMDTLNSAGFAAYRGAGGASMMMRVDQAFRGGGNENFQYMQTLALNPAFQRQNEQRRLAWEATPEGPTDYGAGQYDQFIADVFKDLGAFATPEDVRKQLAQTGFKGASEYVEQQYEASMNKTNLQRTFDIYRSTYGSKNEGQRLFMTAQMAKDMGVGFSDVAVLDRAFQDEEFMRLAKEGKWSPEEVAKRRKLFEDAGESLPELQKKMEAEAGAKETAIQTAKQFQAAKEKFMTAFADPKVTEAIVSIASSLPIVANAIVDLISFFKTDQPKGPQKVVPSPLGDIQIPEGKIDATILDVIPEIVSKPIREFNRIDQEITSKVMEKVNAIIDKVSGVLDKVDIPISIVKEEEITKAIKDGWAGIEMNIPPNSGITQR